MRIAVLANLKQNAPSNRPHRTQHDAAQPETPPAPAPEPPDRWAELDSAQNMQHIVGILERAGHTAAFFEGDLSLLDALRVFRPDLCFNLCEGHYGDSRESHVPALLEMLRIPYTGAGVLPLALTLDKAMTKRVLLYHGLPTPPFQLFEQPDAPLDPALRFPLFVKPVREGSGMGVSTESVVWDAAQLAQRVAYVLRTYQQPALVERFIRGREITVGVLGNPGTSAALFPPWAHLRRVGNLAVLPPYEIFFERGAGGVYTHRIKANGRASDGAWIAGRDYRCPAPLHPALLARIESLAAAAFTHTGCRDVGRIDFRIEETEGDEADAAPYILEVNALPGMVFGWSDLYFEVVAAGLSFDDLILGIVAQAGERTGCGPKADACRPPEIPILETRNRISDSP